MSRKRLREPLRTAPPTIPPGTLIGTVGRTSYIESDELANLEARCEARRRPTSPPPAIAGSAIREATAEWLGSFPLDTFFTLTYADDYARDHYIYSPTSALNDFERFLKAADFPGMFFAASEWHFSRDVPHLHGLLESRGLPLHNLWAAWFTTRGRASFEPPRSDAAAYYCSKYSLKDADADSLRFRLERTMRKSASGLWRPR